MSTASRRARAKVALLALATVAIFAVAAQTISLARASREPGGAVRQAFAPIADHDAGGLEDQLFPAPEHARRDAARRVTAFFAGWSIDEGSRSRPRQLDDNWYGFSFAATQRSTGHRKTFSVSLRPLGETGEPPWKIAGIYLHLAGRFHSRTIL